MKKYCNKCKTEKDLSEFYPRKNRGNNAVRSNCKTCCREQLDKLKKWEYSTLTSEQKTRRQQIYRKHNLKKKYSISLEQYNLLLQEQEGCCGICGTNDPKGKFNTFVVDHNHKTGKVRGLLCNRCNLVLGLLKDDIDVIGNILEYLEI